MYEEQKQDTTADLIIGLGVIFSIVLVTILAIAALIILPQWRG